MVQLEKDIEFLCGRLAVREGCIFLKIQGTKGMPDRIVLGPLGQVLIVEFKRQGGRLSPLQEHMLCKMKQMGFEAEMVDSVAKFRTLLDGMLLSNSDKVTEVLSPNVTTLWPSLYSEPE